MKISFIPNIPQSASVIYSIVEYLGLTANCSVDSESDAQLLVYWYGDTIVREDNIKNGLNQNCKDISKKTVAKLYEKVFGNNLSIDPFSYTSKFVKKSDENAIHDGKVLNGPIDKIEVGVVYQKLVNNIVEDDVVEDIRVPIVGSAIPFVYRKLRSAHERFSNVNSSVTIHESLEFFSPFQLKKLIELSELLALDFGEMDVLIDRDTSQIFVVDVNKTPSGPPNALSDTDRNFAIRKLSEEFLYQFYRSPYEIRKSNHYLEKFTKREEKLHLNSFRDWNDSGNSKKIQKKTKNLLLTPHGLGDNFLLSKAIIKSGYTLSTDPDDDFLFSIYNCGSLQGSIPNRIKYRLENSFVFNLRFNNLDRFRSEEIWIKSGGSASHVDIKECKNKDVYKVERVSSSSTPVMLSIKSNSDIQDNFFYFKSNVIEDVAVSYKAVIFIDDITIFEFKNSSWIINESPAYIPLMDIVKNFVNLSGIDFCVLDIVQLANSEDFHLTKTNPTPMSFTSGSTEEFLIEKISKRFIDMTKILKYA